MTGAAYHTASNYGLQTIDVEYQKNLSICVVEDIV